MPESVPVLARTLFLPFVRFMRSLSVPSTPAMGREEWRWL